MWEVHMNNITYMTGLLTFYLKGNISADQNFVRLKFQIRFFP